MSESEAFFAQVCDHARQTAVLASVAETLGWDERTMMPSAGAEHRAAQTTLLSGLLHERQTDPRLGHWLGQLAQSPLAADPHSDAGATIRQLKRQYDKQVKLPKTLVEELTRVSVLGQSAWEQAKREDDFARLRPWLEQMFALKRQQAEALGYAEHPYDALLDDFEPNERTSTIRTVLGGLRRELVPLVEAIGQSGRRPDISILSRRFPVAVQEALGREAAARIGFDFRRGRLDVTAHPFCAGLGPNDCRITTRYNEHAWNESFFGILHESGHAIYDQGLRREQYGLPPGEAISLGIHESQSRLWENLVGRSRPFWEFWFPVAKQRFPEALGDVSFEAFYFAINDVRPSLVRIEADEATYNLHILIRFELEVAILEGQLAVADLPGAWNDKYQEYLGIQPPNDSQGVLQDIHWPAGLIGYFPTYALGNLYACQMMAQATKDLGELAGQFRQGEFVPLREWLREQVHQAGQCWTAAQLIERVTGRPLTSETWIAYLRGKLTPLYGLA